MAAVLGNSSHESLKHPCNCYVVSSLAETILDTSQIANLKDRYNLGEQLGWGQFGVIRLCTDKLTGEVLACKSIAKERLVTADDAKSVKLEIEIMTRLSGHPNVVDLKAVYEDEDYVQLVMELCAGGELFYQLEKHGRFTEIEARILFKHLMQVVSYCHENGIIHRDLKPENILLATNSSSSPIKLADFGLATYIEPGQSLHGTVGSPFYIAPEVLTGGYNQAADIWSAGVILYILLSGIPPFWGNTKSRIFDSVKTADLRFPSDLWDHVTVHAKELIRGMLCTNPSERLTVKQVLEHSWLMDDGPYLEDSSQCQMESRRERHFGGNSFSKLMARCHDISFGPGGCITCDVQSPTSACRSSFSTFLVEPSTPCLPPGGFSFHSSGEYNGLEFSSPLSSMLSFAFFGPGPATEQGICLSDLTSNIATADSSHGDESTGNTLVLPQSFAWCGREDREMERKPSEMKRAVGTIGSRMLGMHSKRNRTIGLGECEQLDLMVTESVIRWASCTHLPTASSLRSSLVC